MLSDKDKKVLDMVVEQVQIRNQKSNICGFSINLSKYPNDNLQQEIRIALSKTNWCALFGINGKQEPYVSLTKMDNIPYVGKQT